MMDLCLGRYQDVLRDVTCDLLLADPPYGDRTHKGHNSGIGSHLGTKCDNADRRPISYDHWTPDDVREFVTFWAPRTRGWLACMTSSDLSVVWQDAYEAAGLYAFAPVSIIQDRVRLGGDGPCSSTVYLMVARPKTRKFSTWGALPGWYKAGTERNGHIGGKPLDLMRTLVRDYSRPGDLVCDPCAGGATTLLAAAQTGRRGVGAELSPETYAKAAKRLRDTPVAVDWLDTAPKGEQGGLW